MICIISSFHTFGFHGKIVAVTFHSSAIYIFWLLLASLGFVSVQNGVRNYPTAKPNIKQALADFINRNAQRDAATTFQEDLQSFLSAVNHTVLSMDVHTPPLSGDRLTPYLARSRFSRACHVDLGAIDRTSAGLGYGHLIATC